ncbi:hypothetical protein V1517DRAFT_316014 [Lipomyces orientalis]|uniref:Uncharacterized protein n=1 Tax=Lipomyces orientalis TaxID=1233043 RepID=A0ACC3TXI6_9ASCO
MDSPMYELVSYARFHGISTDHSKVSYWSVLTKPATLPLQLLTTKWLSQPLHFILRDDLHNSDEWIDDIDKVINTEPTEVSAKDYIELETLRNVEVEWMKMDEPEVRGPALRPYLERVAPFAYMGNMKVEDPEIEEDPLWIAGNFNFEYKEKLQVTADVMALLSKVTTQTEIITNKVFIYTSLHRFKDKFSSPLLPTYPEREPFEPTSELLTSFPESPLSKWSISETLSPATSLGPISTTDSSPLIPRKRTQAMHFSSPILPAAATSKRVKTVSFPDELPLEAAPPTAYSQVLQRRDSKLASEMRQDAALTTSILQTEDISESDVALRIDGPVVVPLETGAQRRARVKVGFPTTMKDIKGRVKEWRKLSNDWTIRWNPFQFPIKDVIMQQQEDERISNGQSEDTMVERLAELENMESESAPRRSTIADWQLSDEDQNDIEYLQLKDDENDRHSLPDYGSEPPEGIECLEVLVASRKSKPGRLADDGKSDTSQMNKFLPVNPFELFTFEPTASYGVSTDGEDSEEQESSKGEQLREEKRYRDRTNAAKVREDAMKSLGVTAFDPQTKIIVNTTFLTMNRTTYCDILQCTSGLTTIERDYGPDEADILLSSSCGLMVCSFPQIMQRELDGTRIVVRRAKSLFERVERLFILVRISPNISLKTPSDWTALADFITSLAGIRVYLVKESESLDVVRWLISICQQFGGRGNGIAGVETTWERFLRRAGVNGYAAQEILKKMPLKLFVECGHQERLNAFVDLVGLKVLTTVTRVLNAPLWSNGSG